MSSRRCPKSHTAGKDRHRFEKDRERTERSRPFRAVDIDREALPSGGQAPVKRGQA